MRTGVEWDDAFHKGRESDSGDGVQAGAEWQSGRTAVQERVAEPPQNSSRSVSGSSTSDFWPAMVCCASESLLEMQSSGEQLGPNFRALRTGMAICTRRVPAPVKKCRQNMTSAKTVKTGAENDKMQLCGLILVIEGLFNPIGPASSRARVNSSKKARRNRHETQPPQGSWMATNADIRKIIEE